MILTVISRLSNSHSSVRRLPRYRRSENPPAIRKFGFYLPLLELINDARYIDTGQIMALSEVNKNRTYDKLRRLYHNGYIERYFLMSFGEGTRKMIYSLARKGADTLRELYPERFREFFFPRGRRSQLFLDHALMITELRMILTLAFKQKGQMKISDWIQESNGLHRKFHGLKKERLIPDAYFSLQGKTKLHYFLEADCGTMTLSRFAEKIRRYRNFFRKNREALPPRFRVLSLAPTARRTENLCLVTIKSDPQGKGSERFLFLDKSLLRAETPAEILKPLCLVGLKGNERRETLFD